MLFYCFVNCIFEFIVYWACCKFVSVPDYNSEPSSHVMWYNNCPRFSFCWLQCCGDRRWNGSLKCI